MRTDERGNTQNLCNHYPKLAEFTIASRNGEIILQCLTHSKITSPDIIDINMALKIASLCFYLKFYHQSTFLVLFNKIKERME